MTLRRRLLPAPLMSVFLAGFWLVLNNTLDPAHIVLGALLGIAVPWFTEPLRPDKPHAKRPLTQLRLTLVVLRDIVISNIDVARRILGPESRLKPDFVWVPLELSDPHAITLLAGIITMTPGTLSVDVSDDRRWLLVHALDVPEPHALIADIKARYESPLKEIFE